MNRRITVTADEFGCFKCIQYLVGNTRNLESTLRISETMTYILNDLIVCWEYLLLLKSNVYK